MMAQIEMLYDRWEGVKEAECFQIINSSHPDPANISLIVEQHKYVHNVVLLGPANQSS